MGEGGGGVRSWLHQAGRGARVQFCSSEWRSRCRAGPHLAVRAPQPGLAVVLVAACHRARVLDPAKCKFLVRSQALIVWWRLEE